MAEPDSERLSEIQSKIQSGLRVHARGQRRVQSVQLADDLSTVYEELDDAAIPTEGEVDDVSSFFSTTDRGLQRTRKAVSSSGEPDDECDQRSRSGVTASCRHSS